MSTYFWLHKLGGCPRHTELGPRTESLDGERGEAREVKSCNDKKVVARDETGEGGTRKIRQTCSTKKRRGMTEGHNRVRD